MVKLFLRSIAGLGLDSFRKFDPSVSRAFDQILKATVVCCPKTKKQNKTKTKTKNKKKT